jgi:hypothetical protein
MADRLVSHISIAHSVFPKAVAKFDREVSAGSSEITKHIPPVIDEALEGIASMLRGWIGCEVLQLSPRGKAEDYVGPTSKSGR